MTLNEEAENATKLLAGKVVEKVKRHRATEVVICFQDGYRLFIDINGSELELSITEGGPD